MRKLVYVTSFGTRETDYNRVKGTDYMIELEPIKDTESPEMREARLKRIAKAQANVAKAYAEHKALEALAN